MKFFAEVYTVTYLNTSKSSSGGGGGGGAAAPPPYCETRQKIVNVVGILVLKYRKQCS
jgi:hypothetical protein